MHGSGGWRQTCLALLGVGGLLLVAGCGGGGGESAATGSSGTTSTTVPQAPTGVTATAQAGNGCVITVPDTGTCSGSKIIISWNAVSGATSYNLYMASQSGVTKSNYGGLSDGMRHSSVTSPYTHDTLVIGRTYYFVVTAANAAGESQESSQVSAVAPAPLPQ